MTDTTISPEARRSVYRAKNFRRFWTALTVSSMGGHVTILAMPLTAVIALDASAGQLGMLGALQFVPFLFVTPFAGVMADVFPVRLTNALADLMRGVVLLAVPVLAWAGGLSMSWLYWLALLLGCLKVIADVTHHSMLPYIVDDDQLVAGNSAVNTSWAVTSVAGPGLGGVLIQAVTAPAAILVDALSFFFSAATIGSLEIKDTERERTARPKWMTMIREGFGYLFRDKRLLSLGLVSGSVNVFINAYTAVIVLYAVSSLGLSSTALGIVFAAGAVGGVLGSNIARRVGTEFSPATAMLGALELGGIGIASLALAQVPSGQVARSAVLIAGTLVYSAGLSVFNVHAMSTRQKLAQREMLGRVTASYRYISHGCIPLGALLGGAAGERFGTGETIGLAGVAIMLVVAGLFLSPFRRIQNAEQESGLPDVTRLPERS